MTTHVPLVSSTDLLSIKPTIFTDLANTRLQECDRPKCMAIELAKVGANVVTTANYDTLYVWPFGTPENLVVAWHRDNNSGDRLVFHIGHQVITAEMPE